MPRDEEVFDIAEYVAECSQHIDREDLQNDSMKKAALINRCENFLELCEIVYHFFAEIYDKNNDQQKTVERLQLQHDAITGKPQAVKVIKDEIMDFIRANNLLNTVYPSCYKSLSEAVFHEVYGWGPLAKWWDKPGSQSALILDTQIFHDGILQKERFSSRDRVRELIHSLTLKDVRARVNQQNPDLEIEMFDGTRVSISVPPRGHEYEITFRRFLLNDFSLEKLVSLETIPSEALPLFRGLARGLPNTLIVGPVRSGKSHTLKAFVQERFQEKNYTVVSMEKHFELSLRKMLPYAPIIEKQAADDELHDIFPSVLRKDLDFGIMGEIRSVEAECAMLLCERGTRGFLGTFHIKQPHNIPGSWARLIMDRFPNRNYSAEVMRVAENIDIVIVQQELNDHSKKKVTSVVELRFDPINLRVSTHELMRYNFAKDQWSYKYDLSDDLVNAMSTASPQSVAEVIENLHKLEGQSPIEGPNTKVLKGIYLK